MSYNYQQQPNIVYGPQGGMVYNQQYKAPLMTNGLSPEEIKELRKVGNQAAIPQVTQLELSKTKCTHRDPEKNCFTTVDNGDGTVTCTICKETFTPVAYNKEQVSDLVDDIINVLQTTKMNYLDMSPAAVSEFFKMIPLLRRTPELYQQSLNVFNKYDQTQMFNTQGNGNFFNLFSALTSPAMGPGYAQPGYYPQPAYAPQGYPQYTPQPGYPTPQPGYPVPQGYPQAGPVNPFYTTPNGQVPNPVETPNPTQQTPAPGKTEIKNVLNA